MAERLARAVRSAGNRFTPTMLHGAFLSALGRGADAEEAFAEAARLAATDEQKGRVARNRAVHVQFSTERIDEVDDIIADAAVAIDDPARRAEVWGVGAFCHAFQGRMVEAERTARLILSDGDASDLAVMWSANALSLVLSARGRHGEAVELARRGYETAERARVFWTTLLGLGSPVVSALRHAGDLKEAEQAARWHEAAVGTGPAALVVTGFLTGQSALDRGQVRTSGRLLRDAYARIAGQDVLAWPFTLSMRRTVALARAGDVAGARAALADTHAAHGRGFAYFDSELRLAEASVAAAQGAISEAVTLAHAGAEIARSRGQPAFELIALHTAVCFGDRTVAPRLATLAPRVEGPGRPPLPPTPTPSRGTTVRRSTPWPRPGRRSARCCWPPTPPRRRRSPTAGRVGGAPRWRPSPGPSSWRPPARAPRPRRYAPPRPPRRSRPENGRSPTWRPPGCRTRTSPSASSSRFARSRVTSTAPAPSSGSPTGRRSPRCCGADGRVLRIARHWPRFAERNVDPGTDPRTAAHGRGAAWAQNSRMSAGGAGPASSTWVSSVVTVPSLESVAGRMCAAVPVPPTQP